MELSQLFKELLDLIKNEDFPEDFEGVKEKLRKLILEYVKKEVISKEFYEILINLFKVNNTVAREVMVPRTDMIAVPFDITLMDLIKTFSKYKKSKIPVYKENIDNIIGIVNIKDIIEFWLNPEKKFRIEDIIRPPYFIPETKKILDLLKEFKNRKTLFAIVVDEFGGISGVISIVDILEEIVGDFDYEVKGKDSSIKKLDENTYLVDAKSKIEDVEEIIGIKIKDGPYESVGGFIIKEIGRIPEKGEKFRFNDNIEIVINDAFERGVKSLIIKKLKGRLDEDSQNINGKAE